MWKSKPKNEPLKNDASAKKLSETELLCQIFDVLAKTGWSIDASLKEFVTDFKSLKIATLEMENGIDDNGECYDAKEIDYIFCADKNEIFVTATISCQRNGNWDKFPVEAFCNYYFASDGIENIQRILMNDKEKMVFVDGIGQAEKLATKLKTHPKSHPVPDR